MIELLQVYRGLARESLRNIDPEPLNAAATIVRERQQPRPPRPSPRPLR